RPGVTQRAVATAAAGLGDRHGGSLQRHNPRIHSAALCFVGIGRYLNHIAALCLCPAATRRGGGETGGSTDGPYAAASSSSLPWRPPSPSSAARMRLAVATTRSAEARTAVASPAHPAT